MYRTVFSPFLHSRALRFSYKVKEGAAVLGEGLPHVTSGVVLAPPLCRRGSGDSHYFPLVNGGWERGALQEQTGGGGGRCQRGGSAPTPVP